MRYTATVLAFSAFAGSAVAQEVPVPDQYNAAVKAFHAPSGTDMTAYFGEYREWLFDGIEGDWANLRSFGTVDDAALATGCTNLPSRIIVRDSYSFDMVLEPEKEHSITSTYISKGGNLFGVFTDVDEIIAFYGIANTPEMKGSLNNAILFSDNGLATIHRPSPDVLVIQINYSLMEVYARCPTN